MNQNRPVRMWDRCGGIKWKYPGRLAIRVWDKTVRICAKCGTVRFPSEMKVTS